MSKPEIDHEDDGRCGAQPGENPVVFEGEREEPGADNTADRPLEARGDAEGKAEPASSVPVPVHAW